MSNTNKDLAAEWMRQVILRNHPTFDTSTTTPFYDLFIRFPTETQLPDMLDLITQAQENRSLISTNITDSSYDELLANWLIERTTGSKASCTARFIFSTPLNIIGIKTSDNIAIGTKTWAPSVNSTITQILYTTSTGLDSTTEYYFDYPLTAVSVGTASSVVVGEEILDIPWSLPQGGFKKAYVVGDVVQGLDKESNVAVFQRLQDEVSVQNLINSRSINATLSKAFPGLIQNIAIIGHQDPEMIRDLIQVEISKPKCTLLSSTPLNLVINPLTWILFFSGEPLKHYKPKLTSSLSVVGTDWTIVGPSLYEYSFDVELVTLSNSGGSGFIPDANLEVRINGAPIFSLFPSISGSRSSLTSSSPTGIHIGGHTDIYVKSQAVRTTIQLVVPSDPRTLLQIPSQYKPLLFVHGITLADNANTPITSWFLMGGSPEKRFTAEDESALLITETYAGLTVNVDLTYAPLIKEVDSYVNDSLVRVVGESTVVKYYHPMMLSFFLQVQLSANSASAESDIKALLTNYVETLGTGQSLSRSQIVANLHSQYPSLLAINVMNIYGTQLLPSGQNLETAIGDIIEVEAHLEQGVSVRNSAFLIDTIKVVIS